VILHPVGPKENEDVATPVLRRAGDLLFNRDLSLLAFHGRVLEEALDPSHPLLERLKFLAIFSSNIDEFFMIRVSGLKEEVDHNVTELSPDGMSPAQILKEIRKQLRPMLAEQARCLEEDVLPQLEAKGIGIVSYSSLSKIEKDKLDAYFMKMVFPILIPLAVDPAHPFPYISNLSLNLGFMVEAEDQPSADDAGGGVKRYFAYIKLPQILPRLIPVGDSASKFVLLEELIEANCASLMKGMRIGKSHLFRITRDADIEIREEEANDLLSVLEQELPKRRFGTSVRMEVSSEMPAEMIDYLRRSVGLTRDDVYVTSGILNARDLMPLYELDRPELKDKPLRSTVPPLLRSRKSIFDVIKEQDVLLHHPYNPYTTITDFIHAAAHDPDVQAIKISLYRTGHDSPIAQALMKASEQGKQVATVIELKARFDEENNIEWAKRLEHAGVNVVYGQLGLKTHCKVALVVRREGDTLRRYVHIATGNYNPTTSTIYTDIGLLTVDEEIGEDVTNLFNYLTGSSRETDYHRLLVAPIQLRERMIGLIERETEHAKAGRPARIVAKINRLTDVPTIAALYRAAQAGVSIELIVRSTCTLRPGVPGLSETINVRSIVGRFLEHSRIYYFANDGEEEVYIGSSDWMPRNFNRRVEVVIPVMDPRLRSDLIDVILDAYLRDNTRARRLLPDGTYERLRPGAGERAIDSQMYFSGGTR
jgi:polyphosphate kinase